jgi:hypothetical protein
MTEPSDSRRAASPPAASLQCRCRHSPLRSASTAEVPQLDPVQTAALYYYAKERQIGRVEAEIARLQALHPGFVPPPQDLYSPPMRSCRTRPVSGNVRGRRLHRHRRRDHSPEGGRSGLEADHGLSTKLARKKQRVRMKELAQARTGWPGRHLRKHRLSDRNRRGSGLDGIDALSATGDREGLARMFRGLLLRDGQGPAFRRASRRHPAKGAAGFSCLRNRVLAAGLWPQESGPTSRPRSSLTWLARKSPNSTRRRRRSCTGRTLQLLALEARKTSRRPEDLSLLGWHDSSWNNPAGEQKWFAIAMEIAPDPQNAKGMYLSLASAEAGPKAYEFASLHLMSSRTIPAFLMNVLSPRFGNPGRPPSARMTVLAYSTAIMETSAADHAEILGWYAYNSRQYDAAEAWFRQSYDWEASADRLKGLALTMLRQLGGKAWLCGIEAGFRESLSGHLVGNRRGVHAQGHKDAASVKNRQAQRQGKLCQAFRSQELSCLPARNRPAGFICAKTRRRPDQGLVRTWSQAVQRCSDHPSRLP